MNAVYARLHQRLVAQLIALPDKPEETPDSALRALWFTASGNPRSPVAALDGELPALDAAASAKLEDLVEQRLRGVPLAHLTGRQHFMGMEMLVGPGALVPRRETELLARAAVACADSIGEGRSQGCVTAVDVCTGCGNVALAIAKNVSAARVFGADISEDALELARRNADALGLATRCAFRAGDLLAPFDEEAFVGRVDVLTCNPPYISSAKVAQMAGEIAGHEPRLAFDGGPLGVTLLTRLLQDAPRFLSPGGWLAFEVGLGQGAWLARRLKHAEVYCDVRELTDDAGDVRAIVARRRPT